ncbi:hypothetical protein D3C80_2039190 [compost metagenome]
MWDSGKPERWRNNSPDRWVAPPAPAVPNGTVFWVRAQVMNSGKVLAGILGFTTRRLGMVTSREMGSKLFTGS